MAIKFILVEIVLVETVLVGGLLYLYSTSTTFMDDSIAIEGTDDNQILPKFLSKVLTICLILSRPIVFCVTFTAIKKIKVQK